MQTVDPVLRKESSLSSIFKSLVLISTVIGIVCCLAAVSLGSTYLLLLPLGMAFLLIAHQGRKRESITHIEKNRFLDADKSGVRLSIGDSDLKSVPYADIVAIRIRRGSRGKLRYVAVRIRDEAAWTVLTQKPENEKLAADIILNCPGISPEQIRESITLDILSGLSLTAAVTIFCLSIFYFNGNRHLEDACKGSTYGLFAVTILLSSIQVGGESPEDPNKRIDNRQWILISCLVALCISYSFFS